MSRELFLLTHNAKTGAGLASRLRNYLGKLGFTNISIKGSNGGLPYASGFADAPSGLWYFNLSTSLMMRTALDREDYVGGMNRFPHTTEDVKKLGGIK